MRAGSVVIFSYFGAQLEHQIISSGTPSFIPSGPYNPKDLQPVQVFATQLASTGTYSFTDAFNSSIAGQIIVQ